MGSILFCRIKRHKDTWLDPPNLDSAGDTVSRTPALRPPTHVGQSPRLSLKKQTQGRASLASERPWGLGQQVPGCLLPGGGGDASRYRVWLCEVTSSKLGRHLGPWFWRPCGPHP